MPKIEYVPKKFRANSLRLIDLCNDIIVDYSEQGFSLTLRQLYYRLVAGGHIPNSQRDYKRLGSIVNDARLAGLIDWYAIEDRTRRVRSNPHWSSPASIIRSARKSFMLDRWENQPYRPSVWIEKDALVGVISDVCNKLDVPFFSCRGYTSQSAMWLAAMQAGAYLNGKQCPLIIHLGDHDPSGVDMTRDIVDRFRLFVGETVEVDRIALNWDQVEEYSLPPNPTKLSDSRAKVYIAEYGSDSWELDALEPRTIVDLIRDTVLSIRDEDALEKTLRREREMLKVLDDAVKFVRAQ